MRVKLNGNETNLPEGATIGSLLRAQGTEFVRVAVEVNGELVTRREFDQTIIRDGDAIEVVTLVGGG